MKRIIFGALGLLAALAWSGPTLAQGNECAGGAVPGMVVGGTTSGGACYYIKVNSDGSINTTPGTPTGTQDVNQKQVNGATINVGTGASGSGTQRVTTANDSTIATITNPVGVKGADGSAIASVSNPVPVTLSGSATGGVTYGSTAALAANSVIKASAGSLYSFDVNADATLAAAAWWIMIYDATSAPTDGAVTPAKCYGVPLGTTTVSGAFPNPVALGTGITIGVSTTGCFTKTASTHAFISADYK